MVIGCDSLLELDGALREARDAELRLCDAGNG